MPVRTDSPASVAAHARFAHLAGEPVDIAHAGAAMADPDNRPMTDEQLARLCPAAEVHPGGGSRVDVQRRR